MQHLEAPTAPPGLCWVGFVPLLNSCLANATAPSFPGGNTHIPPTHPQKLRPPCRKGCVLARRVPCCPPAIITEVVEAQGGVEWPQHGGCCRAIDTDVQVLVLSLAEVVQHTAHVDALLLDVVSTLQRLLQPLVPGSVQGNRKKEPKQITASSDSFCKAEPKPEVLPCPSLCPKHSAVDQTWTPAGEKVWRGEKPQINTHRQFSGWFSGCARLSPSPFLENRRCPCVTGAVKELASADGDSPAPPGPSCTISHGLWSCRKLPPSHKEVFLGR